MPCGPESSPVPAPAAPALHSLVHTSRRSSPTPTLLTFQPIALINFPTGVNSSIRLLAVSATHTLPLGSTAVAVALASAPAPEPGLPNWREYSGEAFSPRAGAVVSITSPVPVSYFVVVVRFNPPASVVTDVGLPSVHPRPPWPP